jgi:hypothetical protein
VTIDSLGVSHSGQQQLEKTDLYIERDAVAGYKKAFGDKAERFLGPLGLGIRRAGKACRNSTVDDS